MLSVEAEKLCYWQVNTGKENPNFAAYISNFIMDFTMNDNFENETIMAPKSLTHRPISDPVLRKAIYKAFEGKCFYTGRLLTFQQIHIDHVIPKSKGGEDCVFNYVVSCSDVNLAKSHRYDAEIAKRILDTVKLIYAPLVIKNIKKIETGLIDDQFFDPTLYWRGNKDESIIDKAFRDKIQEDVPLPDNKIKHSFLENLKKIEALFMQKLTLELEQTIEIFRRKVSSDLEIAKNKITDEIKNSTIIEVNKKLNLIEINLKRYLNNYLSCLPNAIEKVEIFDQKEIESYFKDENVKNEFRSDLHEIFSDLDYDAEIEEDAYHLEKYVLAFNEFQDSVINVVYFESLEKNEREELVEFVCKLKMQKFPLYHIANFINRDPRFKVMNYKNKLTPLDVIYIHTHQLKLKGH